MDHRDRSTLPAIILSTLAIFYVIWGTLHDLARGDEGMLEWTFFAVSAVTFALVYRLALETLSWKARIGWLTGTGLLLVLYSVAAIIAMIRPKYAKDPLAALSFLAAGVPATALVVRRLIRETRRRS